MQSKLSRTMKVLLGRTLAAVLALGACQTTSTEPGSDGSVIIANRDARLTVLLTDAPGDLTQAWVEITDIYLQGHENGDGDGDGNGQNGGRVHLFEGDPIWVNLLTLADDWMTLVAGVTIPAGTYGQLRFVIGGAAIAVEQAEASDDKVYATSGGDLEALNSFLASEGLELLNGPHGVLHCPSCSQSGLKVRFPGGAVVLDNGDNTLVVDFDVAESFGHQAGNSGRWIMHPTLLATAFPTGDAETGAIVGAVTSSVDPLGACGGGGERPIALSDFVPTATLQGGGTPETGSVDASDGTYTIDGLAPGTYDLGYEATVEVDIGGVTWTISFTADHPADVSVTANSDVQADYNITAVSCSD